MRRTIVLMAMFVTIVAIPVAAQAHASLVESNPSKGQRLDSLPPSVTLTLDEAVDEPAFVVVTAPDGTRLDGDVTVDGRTVSTDLEPSEIDGSYSVAYRLVSADAHTVTGALEFEVAGSSTPSPGSSTDPTPDPDDDPITTTPVPDPGTDSMSAVVIIGFFFVALALLALIIRAGMRAGSEGDDA